MPRPSITWLITDTHFYHHKMITDWAIRPSGYNERIIKNCRRLLAPQDLLIHLGDVIFYKYTILNEILDQIPGRKVLTMGNHDRKSRGWYMNNGFDFVADTFTIDDIVFSHRPLQHLPSGSRINIHGHFHNTDHRSKEPEYNAWYNTTIHRLLALEYTDYAPVRLDEFVAETDRGRIPFRTASAKDD